MVVATSECINSKSPLIATCTNKHYHQQVVCSSQDRCHLAEMQHRCENVASSSSSVSSNSSGAQCYPFHIIEDSSRSSSSASKHSRHHPHHHHHRSGRSSSSASVCSSVVSSISFNSSSSSSSSSCSHNSSSKQQTRSSKVYHCWPPSPDQQQVNSSHITSSSCCCCSCKDITASVQKQATRQHQRSSSSASKCLHHHQPKSRCTSAMSSSESCVSSNGNQQVKNKISEPDNQDSIKIVIVNGGGGGSSGSVNVNSKLVHGCGGSASISHQSRRYNDRKTCDDQEQQKQRECELIREQITPVVARSSRKQQLQVMKLASGNLESVCCQAGVVSYAASGDGIACSASRSSASFESRSCQLGRGGRDHRHKSTCKLYDIDNNNNDDNQVNQAVICESRSLDRCGNQEHEQHTGNCKAKHHQQLHGYPTCPAKLANNTINDVQSAKVQSAIQALGVQKGELHQSANDSDLIDKRQFVHTRNEDQLNVKIKQQLTATRDDVGNCDINEFNNITESTTYRSGDQNNHYGDEQHQSTDIDDNSNSVRQINSRAQSSSESCMRLKISSLLVDGTHEDDCAESNIYNQVDSPLSPPLINCERQSKLVSRSGSRCSSVSSASSSTSTSSASSTSFSAFSVVSSSTSAFSVGRSINKSQILEEDKEQGDMRSDNLVDDNNNCNEYQNAYDDDKENLLDLRTTNIQQSMPASPPPPPPPPPPPLPSSLALATLVVANEKPLANLKLEVCQFQLRSKTNESSIRCNNQYGESGQPTKAGKRIPPNALPTFIPPQFSTPPADGTNIKPSEYLKRVSSNSAISTLCSGGSSSSSSNIYGISSNSPASTESSLSQNSSQSSAAVPASGRRYERSSNHQVTANRFRQVLSSNQQRSPIGTLNRSLSTSALGRIDDSDDIDDSLSNYSSDSSPARSAINSNVLSSRGDSTANLMSAIRNFDRSRFLKSKASSVCDQSIEKHGNLMKGKCFTLYKDFTRLCDRL